MSAALKPARVTVADFIELIRPYPHEERWELIDGEPTPMAPQSERHQVIVSNVMALLRPLARASGCRELSGLGLLNDERDN